MNKPTAELIAGDQITAVDGHKIRGPILVTEFVDVTGDGTVIVKVDQPNLTSDPIRYLRYTTVDVIPAEVTLTDREVGTLIDALAFTRDMLIEKGLTGKDASSALAKITALVQPDTYGLTVTTAARPS